MSISDFLSPSDIAAALQDCQAPDRFNHRKFFQLTRMSKRSINLLKDIFKILDRNQNGFIEGDDLKYFLQRFEPTARSLSATEIEKFLAAGNHNGDGKVRAEAPDSFNHRKFFQLTGMSKRRINLLKDIFKILDRNQNGFIEGDDLKYFLQRFGPRARFSSATEIEKFLAAGNHNGDGKVRAEEFQKMVQS